MRVVNPGRGRCQRVCRVSRIPARVCWQRHNAVLRRGRPFLAAQGAADRLDLVLSSNDGCPRRIIDARLRDASMASGRGRGRDRPAARVSARTTPPSSRAASCCRHIALRHSTGQRHGPVQGRRPSEVWGPTRPWRRAGMLIAGSVRLGGRSGRNVTFLGGSFAARSLPTTWSRPVYASNAVGRP